MKLERILMLLLLLLLVVAVVAVDVAHVECVIVLT